MTDSSLFCSVCDKESDSMGDHAVGCGGNGDRISRHDAICEILFSFTQSACLAPRRLSSHTYLLVLQISTFHSGLVVDQLQWM